MRLDVVIPQMGLMEDAAVSEWLHADGDEVAIGVTIAVVETDKVQVEIQAPAAGVLTILTPAGPDRIPVDQVLGYVTSDD